MHIEATVLKEEILRLTDIPLVIKLPGMPTVARGSKVKLDLLRWDEVDLSVDVRLLDVVQDASEQAAQELDEEMEDLLEADAESAAVEVAVVDTEAGDTTSVDDGAEPSLSTLAAPE